MVYKLTRNKKATKTTKKTKKRKQNSTQNKKTHPSIRTYREYYLEEDVRKHRRKQRLARSALSVKMNRSALKTCSYSIKFDLLKG